MTEVGASWGNRGAPLSFSRVQLIKIKLNMKKLRDSFEIKVYSKAEARGTGPLFDGTSVYAASLRWAI